MAELRRILAGETVEPLVGQLAAALSEDEALPAGAAADAQRAARCRAHGRRPDRPRIPGHTPSAALAVWDSADRIRKRREAQAVINTAKRPQAEQQTQTRAIAADGTPYPVPALEADALRGNRRHPAGRHSLQPLSHPG